MKYKIAKKAWGIDWSKIDEGAYYSGNIDPVHADTRGKAKSLLLPDISEYKLRWSDDDIVFTNIPIVRIKEADKYEFNGELLTIWEYEKKQLETQRISKLDGILEDTIVTHCYIKKGSYYRPNSCGYTDFRNKAGIYTKEDAVSHAKSCSDLSIIPIDIKEHNEMIKSEINDLSSRLIKEDSK